MVSAATLVMGVPEALFPRLAESSAPGWVVALLGSILLLVVRIYVFLVMPILVWKGAFRLTYLSTSAAVVLSWILALLAAGLLQSGYFGKETRIDSLLSAQLRHMIELDKEDKYREASELVQSLASINDDSVQLDSLTLSTLLRAYSRARKNNESTSFGGDDKTWAMNTRHRYSDLVSASDRFQRNYSDAPGMLLKVARAQLESGQCDKARVTFEAVYSHRHSVLLERLFAGLYLRTMNRAPNNLGALLARFGPANDWTFMRGLFSSEGIGLAMYSEVLKDTGNRLVELDDYANKLLDRPTLWYCDPQPYVAASAQ